MTGYASVWEFRVEPGCVEAFERHYGPEGSWAQLFRRAEGYIETLLLKDAGEPLRYVTIDRWRSEQEFRAFRSQFVRAYTALDKKCEALTTHETALGEFVESVRR
jgi:heme-degrading monooxygenase HmoA